MTVIPGTTDATAEAVEERREDMAEQREEMREDAAERREEIRENAAERADDAMGRAENAADAAKEKVAEMADDTAGAGQVALKQAESALQQVQNYVDEGKLDLAETALAKVEGMAASLPAAMRGQVAKVRTALNSAKAMAAKAGGAVAN